MILQSWVSDGDTRLLKTMLYQMKMGEHCDEFCKYLACPMLQAGGVCVQDTIHIATKLRNRLLKTSAKRFDKTKEQKMILGQYEITVEDLFSLVEDLPKSKHLLSKSDLDVRDKMNYKSVEKNHYIQYN